MSAVLDKWRCRVSHQSHSLTFESSHVSSHKLKHPVTLTRVPELTHVSTGAKILRVRGCYEGGSSSTLSEEGGLVGLVLDSATHYICRERALGF